MLHPLLWTGCGAAMVVAVLAGWRDRARRRRRDADAVGPVDWPLVQMLALIAAVMCAGLALNL